MCVAALLAGVVGCSRGPNQPGALSEERQSEAEYDVAREFFSKHQYRQALEHARRAVELNDENAKGAYLTSVVYLAFCASDAESPDCKLPEAERFARLAVKADDRFRDAKNLLGNVLILQKKYKEAIEVLEPLTRDPAYIESHLAWNNLGWAQTESGQLDAAIASLKNAVAQPRFCVGHYRLGLAYEKKADLARAESSFSSALAGREPPTASRFKTLGTHGGACASGKGAQPTRRPTSSAAVKFPRRPPPGLSARRRRRASPGAPDMEMPLNDTLSKSSTSGAAGERERTLRPAAPPSQPVGALLKRQREAKLMSLAEVSRVTRIPLHTLESIEKDRFDDLPGEVFIRGFLKSYARAVGATPQDVIARYASSRRVATVNPLPVASPVQAASEGQGRRFGVAIAFVLLLILFTLALSIVLKPRGRDMPPELSLREPSAAAVDGRG